ncbi:hypothetical protein GCM10007094_41900 [Pseudovibrio japonicus]|uniref:Uncharacterized protein n=1 Tax=Pseudovibrio japonicus TaxID=366534 RepID=A0ABQ3EUZ3_9HYPH|nr:hypothetical protein GCM10007094_41900 [Pseudovibrio japonicus]
MMLSTTPSKIPFCLPKRPINREIGVAKRKLPNICNASGTVAMVGCGARYDPANALIAIRIGICMERIAVAIKMSGKLRAL